MFGDFLPHFGRYSPHTALHEVLLTIASPMGNFLTVLLAIAGALSFPFSKNTADSSRTGHRLLGLSLGVLFLRAFCKDELLTGVTTFPEFAWTAWDICLALSFGVGILGIPLFFCGVWACGAIPQRITTRCIEFLNSRCEAFPGQSKDDVCGLVIAMSFLVFIWYPMVACLFAFLAGVGIAEFQRSANLKYSTLKPEYSSGLLIRPFIVAIALGLIWADTRVLW